MTNYTRSDLVKLIHDLEEKQSVLKKALEYLDNDRAVSPTASVLEEVAAAPSTTILQSSKPSRRQIKREPGPLVLKNLASPEDVMKAVREIEMVTKRPVSPKQIYSHVISRVKTNLDRSEQTMLIQRIYNILSISTKEGSLSRVSLGNYIVPNSTQAFTLTTQLV